MCHWYDTISASEEMACLKVKSVFFKLRYLKNLKTSHQEEQLYATLNTMHYSNERCPITNAVV